MVVSMIFLLRSYISTYSVIIRLLQNHYIQGRINGTQTKIRKEGRYRRNETPPRRVKNLKMSKPSKNSLTKKQRQALKELKMTVT